MKKIIIKIFPLLLIYILNACKKGDTNTTPDPVPPSLTTLSITDFTPKSAGPGSNLTITGTGFGNNIANVKVAIGKPILL